MKKKQRPQIIGEFKFKNSEVKEIKDFLINTICPIPEYSWFECHRVTVKTIKKTKDTRIRLATCYYKEVY